MRILLQRVQRGSVSVEGNVVAEIGPGLVLLVGVGPADTPSEASWLAEKISTLRVFEDPSGKTNLSILDVGGEALVVAQFTLYADTRRGRRPGFTYAAPPEVAEKLVRSFRDQLAGKGISTQMGVFGAHMLVEISNDGPFTILIERTPEDK
jgi:D-tyrosyl-tRNA(Tyr) deacylase